MMNGTFAALASGRYRRLWSGSMLATTAFMMSFMLVPSVAFEITGTNAAAGLAQMGSGIGMFIVSPIGGVIADRLRKKPLVLAGQSIPASVILVVGILILTDNITVPILTIGTLIMGLGFAFMGPARQAWVSELVPRPLLPNAIALQQIAQNISQVAAPLFIALLVGTWVGIGGTYLFMASVFVVVLPLTFSLPDTTSSNPEPRPVLTELVAGVSYVWRDLRLRTLWLGFVGIVVCGYAFQTLLPGLLSQELGRSSTEIGPIFLVLAVAGLLVNLQLAAVVGTRWAWAALLCMGFVMAAGFVLLWLAPSYALVALAAIPVGGRAVGVHAGRQLPAHVAGRAPLPRAGDVAGHDGLRHPIADGTGVGQPGRSDRGPPDPAGGGGRGRRDHHHGRVLLAPGPGPGHGPRARRRHPVPRRIPRTEPRRIDTTPRWASCLASWRRWGSA